MSDFTEKLKVIAQAEVALIKAEARRAKQTTVLSIATLGGIILSIAAANMAIFYQFTEQELARNAALFVVALNLLISAIPAILASRIKPSAEEQMLVNLRDRATSSLTKPVEDLFSSTSSVASLAPLAGVVLKALSKK